MPEAICCCLQTCTVNVVLLVMCLLVFIVTSADMSQIFTIKPEALRYCWDSFAYKLSLSLVLM